MSIVIARLRPVGFLPFVQVVNQVGAGSVYCGPTGPCTKVAAADAIDQCRFVIHGQLDDSSGLMGFLDFSGTRKRIDGALVSIANAGATLPPSPGGVWSSFFMTNDAGPAWTLERVNGMYDLQPSIFYPGGSRDVRLQIDDLYVEVWGTPFSGVQASGGAGQVLASGSAGPVAVGGGAGTVLASGTVRGGL